MIQLRVQDRMKTSQGPAAVIFTAIRHRSASLQLHVSVTTTGNSRPHFFLFWSRSPFKFMFYCQIEKTVTVKCLFTPQRL